MTRAAHRSTWSSTASTCRVTLAVPGRHNVYNALAAAAVGLHLGVPIDRLP